MADTIRKKVPRATLRRSLVLMLLIVLVVACLPGVAHAYGAYTYLFKWGSFGNTDSHFDNMIGIGIRPGGNRVYVVDTNNSRVQIFSSGGAFVDEFGGAGLGNGQFSHPCGIAVDSAGYVYVVDAGNNRIEKFDGDGNYVTQWGAPGSGNSQFTGPYGIAVDDFYVYVVDSGNERIQKFTKTGGYLRQWGAHGSGNTQFDSPLGIALHGGDVYVTDRDNTRVVKYDSMGVYQSKWGTAGAGSGQFSGLCGIACDGEGTVYTVEFTNDRVQKFTGTGTFLAAFGTSGSGNGQLDTPRHIAISSVGNVYVTDALNNRVEVFAPPAPTMTAGGFINPIAYDLLSYLTTRAHATIDQPNSWAVLSVDCGARGTKKLYDGPIAAAGQDFWFPLWNGMGPDGKRLPAASYTWTLKLNKAGKMSTKTGTVLISNIWFTLNGHSMGYVNHYSRYMKPMNANMYLTLRSAASSLDIFECAISGPGGYAYDAGSWAASLSTQQFTRYIRPPNNPKVKGMQTFDVIGDEDVHYDISIVQ